MISESTARVLVKEHYGFTASVEKLVGEVDQNFKVDNDQDSYVLKMSPGASGTGSLEFQTAMMEYVSDQAPELNSPTPVAAVDGSLILTKAVDEQLWNIRMLSWQSGCLYEQATPHSSSLRHGLGAYAARLTQALSGFDHALAHQSHIWDLARAGELAAYSQHIEEGDLRQRVMQVFRRFTNDLQPQIALLPRSVIHGDLNDLNVLVDREREQVSGCIDFGDACYSCSLFELAIAATYASFYQADPGQAISDVVAGYQDILPLSDQEISLLQPLVETRMAVSLSIAAKRQKQRPDDPYITVSVEGARDALLTLGR